MSAARAWRWRWVAGATLALGPVVWACAQGTGGAPGTGVAAPGAAEAERAVEAYLADRGLQDVLIAHLRNRLRASSGTERAAIAEQLGSLYVAQLVAAADPAARQRLEEESRELLKQVPEAETFELRVDLAKATYLKAAELVERDALKMASPADRQEAERVLRAVGPTFQEIGAKVHQRVEALERQEALDRGGEEGREQLARARRVRSLAMYFSGWSECYLAMLTGDKQRAAKAMQDFGWLLNAAGGRMATVERVSKGMLRYPHVARAAMGCALASSLRGNDIEAMKWLDAIEQSEEIPDEVVPQLFTRRLSVLAAAKRWPEADVLVRSHRRPTGSAEATPLRWEEARLLGVLALEAKSDRSITGRNAEIVESLIQTSWGDLVARGEVGHVLDLTRIYGTAPSGQEGFIVRYVRGLQAFERAVAAHRATGEKESEPTANEQVRQAYLEAARTLGLSPAAADAGRFPPERARALMQKALALFRAGEFEAASMDFQKAGEAATKPEMKEEALWSAIVALDRAIAAGKVSRREERDRLAVIYLRAHPGTENAARLLIRRPDGGLLDREQAVQVLLSVSADSPLYQTSRQQASNLLFEAFRRSPRAQKDAAASRFVQVADEVAQSDQKLAFDQTGVESAKAADRAVHRLRQVLEAILSMATPDLDRAESALARIELIFGQQNRDSGLLRPELTFRRLQISWARSDLVTADKLMDELNDGGGEFARAAVREVYQRAVRSWTASPREAGLARAVTKVGDRLIAQMSETAEGAKSEATLAVCNTVAEAAMAVWNADKDNASRELAMRLDRRLVEAGKPTERTYRRLAELCESSGDTPGALQAWRGLLNGLAAGSEEWFEARYQTLRLLAEADPAAAREVMAQHRALYPSYGPEPWGVKLSELDAKLNAGAPPGGGGGGGGGS
ncbi:MAG: hypothetical protein IT436_06920 [Phycisphaerales bacterium]|nr:hypothetical protein [Phycisphaerales bacterium]